MREEDISQKESLKKENEDNLVQLKEEKNFKNDKNKPLKKESRFINYCPDNKKIKNNNHNALLKNWLSIPEFLHSKNYKDPHQSTNLANIQENNDKSSKKKHFASR